MPLDSSPKSGRNATRALRQFVAGPENHLAGVAVQAVLDGPLMKGSPAQYNPLVFHGPAGVGKSHLALGLHAAWKGRSRRKEAFWTTARNFARDLHEAIETKTVSEFRSPFRRMRMLVFENLDYLAGRSAAQQELLSVLNAMLTTNRQVVLTALSAPQQLPEFLPQLQARLTEGLVVPLVFPAAAARATILDRLADLRGIRLSPEAILCLADGLSVSVPQLAVALEQFETTVDRTHQPLDAAGVQRFLDDWQRTQQPSVHEIALLAARRFSLKLSELRSSSRCRAVVTARYVAMYLTRKLTDKSFQQIGQYFGGRDHTTVAHGYRKMEERLTSEPAIREAILQLQNQVVGKTV